MTKPELLEEQSSIANTDIFMATNSNNVTKKITGQDMKMDLGAVNVALICGTAAATAEKVVTGPSITLTTGVTFKVIFSNGNSASSPSINYNSVGALSLKIHSGGSKIDPSLSQMQAGTMLEVYFDGSDFVIMGNPIVYSSSDYTIYADGNTVYKANYCKQITVDVSDYNFGEFLSTLDLPLSNGILQCSSSSTGTVQGKSLAYCLIEYANYGSFRCFKINLADGYVYGYTNYNGTRYFNLTTQSTYLQ